MALAEFIPHLERFKPIIFLLSLLYFPIVTLLLHFLATSVGIHPLLQEPFPRIYLFSIYVSIGIFFIPRLLHVTCSSNTFSRAVPSEFPELFWMQHAYFSPLRLLVRHSHHEPGSEGFKHELCLKNKCICTGCYGTALGIILSVMMFIFYIAFLVLASGQEKRASVAFFGLDLEIIMILGSWMLYSLFLLKYLVPLFKKPAFRLGLNLILPLAFTLLIIGLDSLHGNALVLVLAALLLLPLIPVRVILTRIEEFHEN